MVKKMNLDKKDMKQVGGGKVRYCSLYDDYCGYTMHYVVIDDYWDEVVGIFNTENEAVAFNQSYTHGQKPLKSAEEVWAEFCTQRDKRELFSPPAQKRSKQ